jgi:F-type H+-transporting ATPase subunit b
MAVQSSDAPPIHDVSAGAPVGASADVHVAGAEAEHASGGGLPQFEFQWWIGQIFWLLIIFGVLYVLLSKVFPP